jgi:hypothetical protein
MPVFFGPFRLSVSTGGSLPGGLMINTDYFSDCAIPRLDRLATSPKNAADGVFVTLTSLGSPGGTRVVSFDEPDLSRFPHTCVSCGRAAYIGLTVEHADSAAPCALNRSTS